MVNAPLTWWSPLDVLVATTAGTFLADMVGFPTEASVTGMCPVGADRVRLTLEVLGVTAASEVHYVDAISLHPGTFDGSMYTCTEETANGVRAW